MLFFSFMTIAEHLDPVPQSAQPTVAVIDSQSVRTGLAQSAKGIDGGKKQLSRLFSEKIERRIECGIGVYEIEFRHI